MPTYGAYTNTYGGGGAGGDGASVYGAVDANTGVIIPAVGYLGVRTALTEAAIEAAKPPNPPKSFSVNDSRELDLDGPKASAELPPEKPRQLDLGD